MEQQTQGGQAAPDQKQSLSASRPTIEGRTESWLPPHIRESNINVPVTPGINPDTYKPGFNSEDTDSGGPGTQSPGYFSRMGGTVDPVTGTAMTASEAAAGAKTGDDILRRMSLGTLGRKESLSELQTSHPELSLSGNIISATFNIPHAVKYHKGADWVSFALLEFNCRIVFALLHTGDLLVGWWG